MEVDDDEDSDDGEVGVRVCLVCCASAGMVVLVLCSAVLDDLCWYEKDGFESRKRRDEESCRRVSCLASAFLIDSLCD